MALNAQLIYLAAAMIVAFIGGGSDLRSRRIPNRLTGPAILAGLVLHLSLGGPMQLGSSALAGIIAGSVFLLFFLAGGMGAGDVKLMTAVGCLAGLDHLVELLVAIAIIGGVMGFALALYRRQLRATLLNVLALFYHHSEQGLTTHPELNVRNVATLRLPYAVPIAAGCLLTFWNVNGWEWMR